MLDTVTINTFYADSKLYLFKNVTKPFGTYSKTFVNSSLLYVLKMHVDDVKAAQYRAYAMSHSMWAIRWRILKTYLNFVSSKLNEYFIKK